MCWSVILFGLEFCLSPSLAVTKLSPAHEELNTRHLLSSVNPPGDSDINSTSQNMYFQSGTEKQAQGRKQTKQTKTIYILNQNI